MTTRSRKTFQQLVTLPDLAIPLAETALLVACEEYPQLVLPPYLDFLDQVAANARDRLLPGDSAERTIEILNHTLFDHYGFRGNTSDYYDARNSFLNEVIDRRTGIPIALSTIYIEVAERLAFRVEGVSVPGHFIVRHRSPEGDIFIDPFSRGATLTRPDVLALAEKGGTTRAHPSQWLGRPTHRQILARMLNNLRMIYLRNEAFNKALAMVDLLMLAEPGVPELYRQRGMLRLELGQFEGAARDLRQYLEGQEDDDTVRVRESSRRLARIQAMLN